MEQDEVPKKTVYRKLDESHEEIGEKRTSALGYILLGIMVIFIVIVGETIFSDLGDIPERPTSPSSCVLLSAEQLSTIQRSDCGRYNGFNLVDTKFGLDSQYLAIKPQIEEIASLNKKIRSNEGTIKNLQRTINQNKQNYDLSLQEKMAGEDGIIDKNYAKGSITTNTNQISRLESSNTSLALKRSVLISELSPNLATIKQSHKKALEYYQNKRAWYKFKTFSLILIFVLPFLLVSVFYYLKLKKRNSPYTIILTAVTTAFTILFLQVVLVFLYDILPKEWIERIFRILKEVPLFRYIIHYGSVLLVIGFFGGIVFYIQKRVFSPTKVAIRRLKDKKCPGCSFPLNSKYSFCPDCGLQLKEECSHCGKLKIRYLTHCPNCGNEEPQ